MSIGREMASLAARRDCGRPNRDNRVQAKVPASGLAARETGHTHVKRWKLSAPKLRQVNHCYLCPEALN